MAKVRRQSSQRVAAADKSLNLRSRGRHWSGENRSIAAPPLRSDNLALRPPAFDGGAPFAVSGVPIARDAAVLEAGLDLTLTPSAKLGIAYCAQLGSGSNDQSVQADLSLKF
ncbi:hypothetical protein AB6802_08340 [Mesorhizobium sp. RCC_202]|uniref:hypothetical protein n=1 Tax=Mesorhizobium sp. RCC_202 TaxID=3239222 RepID=UPI0035253383